MSVDLSSAEGVYKLCPSCHSIYSASNRFCARDRTELQVDERIFAGKFILLRKIGEGSMGAVHEAEQPQMGRKVAIKILRSNPEVMLRFEREVQAAGAINHRNVVTIYDSGLTPDGTGFIAMEYLEGESLAQYMERQGPLPPKAALALWQQAVRAMSAAHQKGIVHRDLKPDNMFLSRQSSDEGSESVLKVLDFGIAKFHKRPAPAKGTTPGMIIGTMQYMAPEQLQGAEADPRADVYALGLILVEMLTGRLPWGQSKDQSYSQFALRMVQPPQDLTSMRPDQTFSADLQRVIREMLATEPEGRPAHAGDLLLRLKLIPELGGGARGEGALASEHGDTLRQSSGEAGPAPRAATQMVGAASLRQLPTRLRTPAAIALACALLIGGIGFLAMRRTPPSVPLPAAPVPSNGATAPVKESPPVAAKPVEPVATASKPAPHRAAHSAALQVQFAVTEPKGVTLTCSGRKLGAPSCAAGGMCKWSVQVASGQKCVAQKGSSKKLFTYPDLSRTPADRKNLIHVFVRF